MRPTTQQRTATAVNRFVATALVLLWGFSLAPYFGMGTAMRSPQNTGMKAASRPILAGVVELDRQAPESADADDRAAEEAHRKVCHCLNCPGYKTCCCGGAKSPRDAYVFRSVCDSGTAIAAGAAVLKTIPPASRLVLKIAFEALDAIEFPTWNASAASRSPDSRFLPPRLS